MRPYQKLFLVTAGAASTAVEIAGFRLVAPIFGSSLPIWGGIIAAVLAGLATGYSWGAKRAQRPVTFTQVQQHAAVAAAVFLVLPLGMRVSLLLRNAALDGDAPGLALIALFAAWLSLVPPSVLFGMISPLAVEALSAGSRASAGYVAGTVSMLTTLGSLVGILLPSLVLVPLVGTHETIWLFAGAVLLLSAPALMGRRSLSSILVVAAALALDWLWPRPVDSAVLYHDESPYQYVTVAEKRDGTLELIYDAGFGIQSVKPPGLYAGGYWDYAAALPVYLAPADGTVDVLVLGAAVSATERQLTRFWPDTTFAFTSVEIDPTVVEVAEQYFDPPARNIVVEDARTFAARDTGRYDLILVDAYSREISVPFHLTTREFFAEAAERLEPGGIIALNINASSAEGLYLSSIAATLRASTPHTFSTALPHSCNHLVLGSHEPLREKTQAPAFVEPLLPTLRSAREAGQRGFVLTDNRAPTDLLGLGALCGLF
jgi:spermidine synthase